MTLEETRQFIIETAKKNIQKVESDKDYVKQAQQVNTSLTNIVTMERNMVMTEALRISEQKQLRMISDE